MTGIFIVKQLGTVQSFESRKNPGQSVTCADAVLREMGSPDYADSVKVRLFGKNATNPPRVGDAVFGKLRFRTEEHDGKAYMDCTAEELTPVATIY